MKFKRLFLILAAALVLQLGMLSPAMASDTDTYTEDDPQFWRETQSASIENRQLQALGINHSDYSPRDPVGNEVIRCGIDVSSYQGNIDWAAVADAGIEFAFIRAGYRGWGTAKLVDDSYMAKNIEGALVNGIQVGIYVYSQATTAAEAEEEAQFILDRIDGYEITLPLVIDYEYAEQNGRYVGYLYDAKLSKDDATAVCNAFCAKVEAAGYSSAVYANLYMLNTQLIPSSLSGALWLAQFATSTTYTGDYDFWQCTSSGSINGVPTENVDLDFWFDDSGAPPEMPFTDVARTRWSYNEILHAYKGGLINGLTTTTFGPQKNATRAQLATMLYRMAGTPEVTEDSTFTDLTQNWYLDAVAWAQQNGIIEGTGKGKFSPSKNITREQLVTMLYRMHKSPETTGTLDSFSDSGMVSSWAKDAVCWAVEIGILQGSDGKINPKRNATREQVAALLVRYMAYAETNPVVETEPDEEDSSTAAEAAPEASPAPSPKTAPDPSPDSADAPASAADPDTAP